MPGYESSARSAAGRIGSNGIAAEITKPLLYIGDQLVERLQFTL